MANMTKKIKTEAKADAEASAVSIEDIAKKMDRIIELLEGTLVTKPQGFNLKNNPWLDRMLSKV